MSACAQVKKGVAAPCEPAAAGLKTQLVVIRYDDIASVVRDATNPKLVNITLKTGKKGFLFEGLGDSNAARVKYVPGKYIGTYTHEVDLVSFGIGPEDSATVQDLAKDRVVTVVPDNNGYYKVHGLNAGLTTSKLDTDTANKDTGGAPEITISSDKEKGLADFFAKMDTTGATPVIDPVATAAAFTALYV